MGHASGRVNIDEDFRQENYLLPSGHVIARVSRASRLGKLYRDLGLLELQSIHRC